MPEDKKILNKGLDALLGQSNTSQRVVKEIDINKIKPGRFQPRSNFDNKKLEELTASIKNQGVLSPILVRELGLNEYEVIAGERRLRASKTAGLNTIPCLVDQKQDQDALVSALIENLQREDLNPVEEARGLDRLKREFGLTQEEVAASTGKARSTIANSLRLLSLPPRVLDMLSAGQIEKGHAKLLASLNPKEAEKAAENIIKNKLSVKDLNKISNPKSATKNANKKIKESGISIESIDQSKYEDMDVNQLQDRLADIQAKIIRLGAINLAAPEEIAEESKRKEELDIQYDDLTEAMDKLAGAIKTIDQETKTRFKDSFDAINLRMKEVFSKLFGGGFAELALTEDDALNSGVVIMARPPGKKNSSISQLSGGEKALTALALVFAIFELNPAPFCILDEVDAPLDDLNTMRFINMVEEMSKTVQFIFITHNKVSMEKSDHLMGVTMQEAGVSRMVTVDVNQALEFAEA